MKITIDTNVPIAANGRNTHATAACQLRCVELLEEIAAGQINCSVTLDEMGLLLDEYSRHLNYRGEPGIGDFFFKFLHDNLYSNEVIKLIKITPIRDERRGFHELPPNSLDPSDRKFLAVAVKAKATIVNALDTDWHEQKELLSKVAIKVRQLCPQHACIN